MDELIFRKSSYSGTGNNCVEVADVPSGDAAVRDSMHPHEGHVVVSGPEWSALLGAVRRR